MSPRNTQTKPRPVQTAATPDDQQMLITRTGSVRMDVTEVRGTLQVRVSAESQVEHEVHLSCIVPDCTVRNCGFNTRSPAPADAGLQNRHHSAPCYQ
jgi:hypothetical protein